MGLDSVELIMAVEETFAVRIPDWRAAGIVTVGDLFAETLVLAGIRPASSEAHEAWARLVALIAEETGVAPQRIVPSAAIVEDLGID